MIFKSSRIISLTFFAALILIPSLIVVLGSFKTDSEVYNKPLSLPENWNLDNYQRLISESDLEVSFRNSVVVTLLSVIFTLLFASLASFDEEAAASAQASRQARSRSSPWPAPGRRRAAAIATG